MVTGVPPAPESVRCRFCGVDAGLACMTRPSGLIAARHHPIRARDALAAAAHADPVLDEWFPARGPCGFCGAPGLDARHRVIDSAASLLESGDDEATVADELDLDPGAVAVVARWMSKWEGAWL